jgi:1-phosphatidylinositol-4-phosphate 5-kinase
MDGLGQKTWSDGRVYRGAWKADSVSGKGAWSSRPIFSFFFFFFKFHIQCSDQPCGHAPTHSNSPGTMVWPSGETYVGYFVDGLFHGKGQRTWPNGDCYSGEYEEGKEHGDVCGPGFG